MVMGAIWNRSEEIHVVDKGYGEATFMIEPGTDINSIQAYTIRSVMKMMNTDFIDILKIDIEGSEKEIFESGYEEWLSLTKIIIVETLSAENLVFYNNNLINPY
jgi:FkbM family methyltransferase